MRKIVFTFLIVLFVTTNNTQAQGINFEHISLDEALAKAASEDKLVFVDFYTVWCAPCKVMSKKIFPLPEVGEAYNKNFISIKLDAEKKGALAAKKYNVSSYPTLAFINSSGKLVYKDTGSQSAESFINLGKKAIASLSSEFSLEKLQQEFPNKQNDEHFLKIYVEKMIEYGQSPIHGIEAWLTVQTEIKEDDVDMMEYLMKHNNYLLLNSKAEQILKANFDEYMDIATRAEERELKTFHLKFIKNTRDFAIKTKDAELMRSFIDTWKQLPNRYRRGNPTEYELIYLAILEDYDGYKKLAQEYISGIINAKPIAQIQKEDAEYFETFQKNYKTNYSINREQTMEKLKSHGKIAGENIETITKIGHTYLKLTKKKKDYKVLESWIEYGYELVPNSFYINDLKADMLYKKGKTKQAIALKKIAVEKWIDSKTRPSKAYELEKMQKGETL
ncbi:thioredoxin family protein [Tenacibaculum aestuarii]|uniref:thioredoxin family protein n=1 Tax=Tenacibaculum aestuarii TaxID=362781 RepID=UPI0038962C6C